MKKEKRHQIILNEVHIRNRVLLKDLATLLNVSMDTVRRDIVLLDEMKKLRKVHGGAVSIGFNIYTDQSNEIYERDNKIHIAQKAISLLNKGDFVLITGGSTNIELAKLLPKNMDLTFFTPSLPMAIELINSTTYKYDVYLIGGKLSKGSQLVTGGSAINTLTDISADICFLGTGYLDTTHGITEVDLEIAQMKRAMIKSSKRLVSLTISKKLNTSNRFKICDINSLDTLVTELDPNSEELNNFRKSGVRVL